MRSAGNRRRVVAALLAGVLLLAYARLHDCCSTDHCSAVMHHPVQAGEDHAEHNIPSHHRNPEPCPDMAGCSLSIVVWVDVATAEIHSPTAEFGSFMPYLTSTASAFHPPATPPPRI